MNERHIPKTCGTCDKPFMAWHERSRFCSKACQYAATRTSITRICQFCGGQFMAAPAREGDGRAKFCSKDCLHKHQATLRREQTGNWKGGDREVTCLVCGKVFEVYPVNKTRTKFCSWECRRRGQQGSGHPGWKGGLSFLPYSAEFTAAFKRMIRDRDNEACAICRLPGRSVHHVDYDKTNTTGGNCITLCRHCHTATNHHRTYWQGALTALLAARCVGAMNE